MEKYDYLSAVEEDVKNYIECEVDFNDFEDLDELQDYLDDTLWTDDSVTGNGSGSYTFSTWLAEENLCHNLDLLDEAINELGGGEHYGKIDFDGIISNVEHAGKFPNHKRVFPAVSNDLALHIGNAWGEAKKFVKKADSNIAYISGTAGNSYITLECGNNKRNIEIENTLACDFLVAALNKTLKSCEQIDTLYLGEAANCPIVATNSLGNAYLIMPAYIEEGEYKTFVKCEGATFDVNVLEERDNNHTQSVETAKIDAPAVEAKKELEPEQKTATKAATKVATLDADAKKFTFAAARAQEN